jgi:hypothetical protein
MAGTRIDLEKMRSIGVISRRSGDQVREGHDRDGHRFKATTDEIGNTVTERHGDRQDVTIRAPHIRQHTTVTEER